MKYPKTPHLDFSGTIDKSDKKINSRQAISLFEKDIIIFEKLDGENTIFSDSYIHARSEDGYNADYQSFMKRDWSTRIKFDIPERMIFCGENLYATHSINYNYLHNYFYIFNIISDDKFLSVDKIIEWCELANIDLCPYFLVLTKNSKYKIKVLSEFLKRNKPPKNSFFGNKCEGFVVRNIESFEINDFENNVAKYVRKNRIQTDDHWRHNWKVNLLNYYQPALLSREDFTFNIKQKYNDLCVVCGKSPTDAHHLIERKLWDDGGYYVENGVALCAEHHLEAERTIISVEELRVLGGIYKKIQPYGFSNNFRYNKWGNVINMYGNVLYKTGIDKGDFIKQWM